MIIDCISDLHGFHPILLGGDLLIVAGDLTARDYPDQFSRFKEWLSQQKYTQIIVIAGNHDGLIEKRIMMGFQEEWNRGPICYLEDSRICFNNFKIWGSPWTPTFIDWHFMKDRGEEIKKMWDLIPDDTDILITHGPPYGILDEVMYSNKANNYGKHAGCEELRKTIDTRLKNLKLHVFGHVHESYGTKAVNGITYVNASIMDDEYRPVNKPIRIEI